MTVLVTTSRICLTLLVAGFEARQSVEYRALRAASQSNGERTERALKGERAMGESIAETAGDLGTCRLGKDVAPVGGADIGSVG